MTFSSLSPWPDFAFGPVGFGRTWLNNWIWLKPPQFQLFRVPRFLNVPEENVSSDEELYTPFERCNMSAPPVLQDSHSLRCCKDLLEMPVYNAALCCTNLSVTSLSLSLQDRSRRTQGPKVSLILGSTSEQRTSIHKSVYSELDAFLNIDACILFMAKQHWNICNWVMLSWLVFRMVCSRWANYLQRQSLAMLSDFASICLQKPDSV
jgi:hypothetical protein